MAISQNNLTKKEYRTQLFNELFRDILFGIIQIQFLIGINFLSNFIYFAVKIWNTEVIFLRKRVFFMQRKEG
jgi:hypothetical protein